MNDQHSVLMMVMAVPLITWAGLFAYLLMIDRSMRRLEHEVKEHDQL